MDNNSEATSDSDEADDETDGDGEAFSENLR